MAKSIREERVFTNPYDGNTTKKVVIFLKGWDAGVMPYAKNWKLSYFN